MSEDHLTNAADAVTRAADGTDTERAEALAETLRSLADRAHGPDHGRLARIENALVELREEASAALDEAKDHVEAYREGVPGV